jgi:three-Cys-motif partner protein
VGKKLPTAGRATPPDIVTAEDGRETLPVGEWAEEKGRLLWYYCDLFATSMKGKWDERVYIDLFAGAGKVRVRGTDKVLLGSPLLALIVRDPFNRYIFCEQEPIRLETLRHRVVERYSTFEVRYIEGDVNSQVSRILAEMPSYATRHKVLGFCFADPYGLQDLKFSTIKGLAMRFMDFLILIPAMDPQRAWEHYLDPKNTTVDEFLGNPDWRSEWQRGQPPEAPDAFVARFFDGQMKELGFRHGGIEDTVLVRSTSTNTPLYRLGFFSKHPLGGQFWRQAKKYTSLQRELF